MSTIIAVVGESGSGKTTSIRNLDRKTTAIISPINKPLPIKGFKKKYTEEKSNYMPNVSVERLPLVMQNISEKGTHIKTIVIDDWQYTMADEFMERASELGYVKFTEIGRKAYKTIKK